MSIVIGAKWLINRILAMSLLSRKYSLHFKEFGSQSGYSGLASGYWQTWNKTKFLDSLYKRNCTENPETEQM